MVAKKTQNVSDLLQQAITEMSEKHYGNVYTADQLNAHFSVVPVREFSFRWLLDANGIFLSKVYFFEGEPGAGKSQFGYDIGARFVDFGGVFILVETENKTSQVTLEAKMGAERISSGRVVYHQTYSVDAASDASKEEKAGAWQTAVSNWISKFKDDDILFKLPVFILVDSMTGVAGSETREEFNKHGTMGGRTFAEGATANSIARFFRNIGAELANTNITLAFTNHIKPDMSSTGGYGPPKKRSVGGEQPKFHSACTLRFTKGPNEKQKKENELRRTVKIKVIKQSFGVGGRELVLPFYVRNLRDENGDILDKYGNPVREINWDWDEATCILLYSFCAVESKGGSKALHDLLPIDRYAGKYSVKSKGIEPSSPREFCEALAANAELNDALRGSIVLSYNNYPVFESADGKAGT